MEECCDASAHSAGDRTDTRQVAPGCEDGAGETTATSLVMTGAA